MAVILKMNIPDNCYECELSNNYFGTLICPLTQKRANKLNCSLKSADEMVEEIDTIPSELSQDGRRLVRKTRVMDIINQYCGEERENADN